MDLMHQPRFWLEDKRQEVCGFSGRSGQHEAAAKLVESALEAMGFRLFSFGVELNPELAKILRSLQNGTSRMLRYRPDRVAVHPGRGSLLVEIKSEKGASPNFAVEFDAWDAAREWNQEARRVLYVFVTLADGMVLASWPDDLAPTKIFVPRSEDWKRISERASAVCPSAVLKHLPESRGSGTAFFTVPKAALAPVDAALAGWYAGKVA
ncbi:MAG: hypothetical protein PWQ86_1947 [Bacillota bacterium]|nr:hypothetical protein [Bacillota bacterium]